jgi:hypothetical protein
MTLQALATLLVETVLIELLPPHTGVFWREILGTEPLGRFPTQRPTLQPTPAHRPQRLDWSMVCLSQRSIFYGADFLLQRPIPSVKEPSWALYRLPAIAARKSGPVVLRKVYHFMPNRNSEQRLNKARKNSEQTLNNLWGKMPYARCTTSQPAVWLEHCERACSLDDHVFAVIPQEDIRHAVNAVAQILRDESASMAEPGEESSCVGC